MANQNDHSQKHLNQITKTNDSATWTQSAPSQKSRSRYWNDVLDQPVISQSSLSGTVAHSSIQSNHNTSQQTFKTNNPSSSSHRRFQCQICGNRFERRGHLESHVEAVHEGRRSHRCPTGCGKAFAHRSSLHRHIKSAHDRHTREVTRNDTVNSCFSNSSSTPM